MFFRFLSFVILINLFPNQLFSQENHLQVFPERYELDLPNEWGKPKIILAITNILPETIAELKDKLFCIKCKAGYTVRLIIEAPEIISENIQDQQAIKKKVSYLYTQTYKFRAALGIYDSLENITVELLLVDPKIIYTFQKEFTIPVLTYVSVIQNQQGQVIKQTYESSEKISPSTYVADHKQEFKPTLYDFMAIAEQKVFEIEALIKKLAN